MRALWKLTGVEMKLFFREPTAAFFTIVFPLTMLFLFGSIYGNEPTDLFGGWGVVDVSVPGYTAMVIATSGLLGLAMVVARYRDTGVLRRLRGTPLGPVTVLTAQLVVLFVITLIGMAFLVVAGRLVYDLRFGGDVWSVLGAFVLSCGSIFSLGFVLASVLPTARAVEAVAFLIFFPMLFLSGASIPREGMPQAVLDFAQWLPLTHVVTLLRGLWFGGGWGDYLTEVAVLVGVCVVCTLISARTFRWE